MERPIALVQSDRIRNAHRLAEINDAQKAIDKLESDLKQAITTVMKEHGLELKQLQLSLSLRSGKSGSSMIDNGPDGWFSGSMSVK